MFSNDVRDPGHLVFGMIEKGKPVAAAVGVTLYIDPMEMIHQVAGQSGERFSKGREPSMLVDVSSETSTEIGSLTAVIVKEAARKGIPAPLNETLYCLIGGVN